MTDMEIVLASRNKKKIAELEALLRELCKDIRVLSLDDIGYEGDIEEDGKTFEENALIKASVPAAMGYIGVADDSGLCVEALDGAPGVYSARYSEEGSDEANNRKLISLIKDVPYEKRTARFVSVITMVYPDGRSVVARGEVEGHLLLEPHGGNGFGYDPLFVPVGYDETFGVIDPEVKNRISHRANALKVLREKLMSEEGNL